MSKVPKSVWVIFDPIDGPHIFTGEKSAWKTYKKWHREAKKDARDTVSSIDSFWDMSEPTEYRLRISKEDKKELLKQVNNASRGDAMFCAHANENPAMCYCLGGCYCKSHTCKGRE